MTHLPPTKYTMRDVRASQQAELAEVERIIAQHQRREDALALIGDFCVALMLIALCTMPIWLGPVMHMLFDINIDN